MAVRPPFPTRYTLIILAAICSLILLPAARADMSVGVEAFAVKDYKRAYREFETAWKAGDPKAAYNLGMMHGGGYGIGSSKMEAAKWYRLAADGGVAEAQNIMGAWYQRGVGVRKDPYMALEMYIKSASSGYAPARFNLGIMYYSGLGLLKKDLPKAVELFSLSANAGHAPAQYALGELLNSHEEIEANRIVAWQWLALAVDGGENAARRSLEKLTAELPAPDLASARAAYNRVKASMTRQQETSGTAIK